MKKVLFVVDLQKQFKDSGGQYEKCLSYIKEHQNYYDYVIGTVFHNLKDSLFVKNFGYTDCTVVGDSDIEYERDEIVIKLAEYGVTEMCVVLQGIKITLRDNNIEIHVIGCETEACVMATAFNLWDAAVDFKILSDLVYTNATEYDNETAIKILKHSFGKCVTTSSEVQ